jgi:hypothetical protein
MIAPTGPAAIAPMTTPLPTPTFSSFEDFAEAAGA